MQRSLLKTFSQLRLGESFVVLVNGKLLKLWRSEASYGRTVQPPLVKIKFRPYQLVKHPISAKIHNCFPLQKSYLASERNAFIRNWYASGEIDLAKMAKFFDITINKVQEILDEHLTTTI